MPHHLLTGQYASFTFTVFSFHKENEAPGHSTALLSAHPPSLFMTISPSLSTSANITNCPVTSFLCISNSQNQVDSELTRTPEITQPNLLLHRWENRPKKRKGPAWGHTEGQLQPSSNFILKPVTPPPLCPKPLISCDFLWTSYSFIPNLSPLQLCPQQPVRVPPPRHQCSPAC